MPDGSEWGVQAKWFLTSPGAKQWAEVDESVITALDRHPRLTRYAVCMPIDLSDARSPGKTSARQRWEARRGQFEGWAAARGMAVAFEFRGSHELAQQLMTPANRGLLAFLFGGPQLSPESVKRRIEDTVSAVGPRYSKELNVDVPLSRFVDAMMLSDRFIEHVFAHYRALRKGVSSLHSAVVRAQWASQADHVAAACACLCNHLEPLHEDRNAPISWDTIAEIARDASAACRALSRLVREAGDTADASVNASAGAERNPYEHQVYDLWKLASALESLYGYAHDAETRLSRAPYLLLVGEAGSGKTHFLCDVAVRVADAGNVALLVLAGEDFDRGGLWREIAHRNGLSPDQEVLLGAVQAAAEAAGTRALILIDGINEGPHPAYWQRELSIVINQIKRYPRVGLVVSVRDTFLAACVRDDARAQMLEIVHEGFAYDIIEAQRAFFRNFGIREPAVPLLLPEFANPLFLTLFCKGIIAADLAEVPRGLSGLTAIFQFFVDAQNRKISAELDVDVNDRLVHRALDALASILTPQRPNTLDRAEAKAIVEGVYASPQFSRSLFGALEREGLISTMRYGDASYIRFTYERMADHARARNLLDEVENEFQGDRDRMGARIAEALAGAGGVFRSEGLFEALSLQVPERYGREILALLPQPHYYWQLKALLRALPWRRPDSVGPTVTSAVFQWLETEPDLRPDVVDCLLSCALVVGSPLNAAGLHAYLRGFDMPRRDAVWTIAVSARQYEGSAVTRMMSWAREGAFGLDAHATDSAAEAAGVTLLWLCTSTNRRVRDEATKGVVAILDAAPTVAAVLHERFWDCNDPYVVQRLYAALAGHSMRTSRATENLAHLARIVLGRARNRGLPVDMLARDYARTIVERALFLGAIEGDIDISAVRPPYGADPPDLTGNDDELFERYSWKHYNNAAESEQPPSGLLHVHSSLDKHGDFARYIVGTNSRGDWLSTRLTQGAPLTLEQLRATFAASLTPAQAQLHEQWVAARRSTSVGILAMLRRALAGEDAVNECEDPDQTDNDVSEDERGGAAIEELYRSLTTDDVSQTIENGDAALSDQPPEEPAKHAAAAAESSFVASLDESQVGTFNALERARNDFDRFDLVRATHWMFRRILEVGYGGAEVYAFDERAAREAWEGGEGRQPATIERIGKKYQWIAYFEFSARMADNYYLEGWRSDGIPVRCDVPTQVLTRDIDPSLLIVNTKRPSFEPHPQSWWSGPAYADWQEHVGIDEWMRDGRNLPDPAHAIAVVDPAGAEWICLNTHLSWREREVLLQDRYDVPRRDLWYLIFGYLVPKSEAQRAYRWLRRQNFSGRWLRPEPGDTNRLFWGELFWAPSFALEPGALTVPPTALGDVARKCTKDLLVPATGSYVYERGNDNSVLDTLRVDFPIADIVRGVGAVASDPERGAWFDASRRIVCIDPSVAQPGPGAALVRRDSLEAFLKNSPFALLWTLLSEKQIIGGNTFRTYYGRLVTSGAYWMREAADGTFSLEGGKTSRFEG